MYKILIIEDESAAQDNLVSMLRNILGDKISSMDMCESIKQSVEYINTKPTPDIIFMDINLADGNSFSIFDKVEIKSPIIFTTAYDEYALKAFTVNSIDYILKPLHEKELQRAITKWLNFSASDTKSYVEKVSNLIKEEIGEQRSFLIQVKDKIVTLNISEIAFCYTSNEQVTAYTKQGQTYVLNFTLETLSKKLSTTDFFRANRQFIISRDSIGEISIWFGNRLKVKTKLNEPEDIIISKLKVPEFKKWLAI